MLCLHPAISSPAHRRTKFVSIVEHYFWSQHSKRLSTKMGLISQTTSTNPRTKYQQGVTLVELIVVIAIIGILAAVAVPAYQRMIEANRLKQVVESFKSDMQLARTRAIKQSADVIVSRTTGNAGAWCYGLSATTTSCDCNLTTAATTDDCEIKSVSGSNFGATNMYSASGNSTFDFRRGTIGNNGVTFTTAHYAARVVFSQVGRVSICTPAAADRPADTVGLPGIPNCS